MAKRTITVPQASTSSARIASPTLNEVVFLDMTKDDVAEQLTSDPQGFVELMRQNPAACGVLASKAPLLFAAALRAHDVEVGPVPGFKPATPAPSVATAPTTEQVIDRMAAEGHPAAQEHVIAREEAKKGWWQTALAVVQVWWWVATTQLGNFGRHLGKCFIQAVDDSFTPEAMGWSFGLAALAGFAFQVYLAFATAGASLWLAPIAIAIDVLVLGTIGWGVYFTLRFLGKILRPLASKIPTGIKTVFWAPIRFSKWVWSKITGLFSKKAVPSTTATTEA